MNDKDTSLMTKREDERPAREKLPAADLLPILYNQLRRLAGVLTTGLPAGQTLEPTALVHEAYLRLVRNQDPGWEGRAHFFGAAAKAMGEILIEQARRQASFKHGGRARRIELAEGVAWIEPPSNDLLALDDAIEQLAAQRRVAGGDCSAPLLHGTLCRGNGRDYRRIDQHSNTRLAICAGMAGGTAGGSPVMVPANRIEQRSRERASPLPPFRSSAVLISRASTKASPAIPSPDRSCSGCLVVTVALITHAAVQPLGDLSVLTRTSVRASGRRESRRRSVVDRPISDLECRRLRAASLANR